MWGSRQLIRILNTLGCTTSADTRDRFVTNQAELQWERNMWDDLLNETFTVVFLYDAKLLCSILW